MNTAWFGGAALALMALVSPALAQTPAAATPTPRLANGKPDLSGYWANPNAGGGILAATTGEPAEDEDVFVIINARDGDLMNLENDSYVEQKAEENIPIYKPEHWAKVRDLDMRGNAEDPAFHCMPQGVPRMGPPNRIIANGDEVILFNNTVFRIVKVGRKRTEADTLIETWNGIPEARWDGDTLVVESIGFNDQSWMGWGGFFHSYDLKVTETFRRDGDTLVYTSVAEDPTVLQEPWKLDPITLRKNPNPNATIAEATPCSERDAEHIVDNIRG